MKIIRLGWRVSKSGRMTQVIKNRQRIIRKRLTNHSLPPYQREKLEILQILNRRRVEQERELKRKLKKNQKKAQKMLLHQDKKPEYKSYCSSCDLVKVLNNITYGVSTNGVLYVKGECSRCGRKNITRLLRRATPEELKAAGKYGRAKEMDQTA